MEKLTKNLSVEPSQFTDTNITQNNKFNNNE